MTAPTPTSADGPAGRILASAGALLGRVRTRLGPRGTIAAAGAAAIAVAVLGLGLLLRPAPIHPVSSPIPSEPGSVETPMASGAPVGDILPTPSTTDVVLLVRDAASLSPTEAQWLGDLRANLGRVDPLAYADASLGRLQAYFVVFVVDDSPDLDVAALADAYHAGLTVHLVGPAAAYRDRITAAAVAP